MIMKKYILLFAMIISLHFSVQADVKPALVFQSNMVLQRDKDCAIWGTADPKEKVAIFLNEHIYKGVADYVGQWKIVLPAQPAGGPFQIKIKGKNLVILDNILFGDIWICGGQSNMQFKINELSNKLPTASLDNNKNIRIFTAGIAIDYVAQDTLISGEWKVATMESIENFSAVGFLFGFYLQQNLNVPIGLISDNLGATSVETWMSPEAISKFPQFDSYYQAYLAPKKSFKVLSSEFEKMKPSWEEQFYLKNDPGLLQQWYLPGKDSSGWKPIQTPGYWEGKGLPDYDGSVWFNRSFDLPDNYDRLGYSIGLGQVDDYNIAWVNGHKIGETFGNLNYSNYTAPDSILQSKNNTLMVRVFDAGGMGGMYNQFWNPTWTGNWKYKPGIKIDSKKFKMPSLVNADLFASPSILFNACIAPIKQLSMKGVIWYQGESNASRAEEYKQLFPAFIQDWRKQFNQGDFPFIFTQLANFYSEPATPQPSDWAEIRESQAAALALPNTGMAVTIDIGEAYNIHPKNKQDLGKRLGIAALKVAYGFDSLHLSPQMSQFKIKNDIITIEFDNNADSLITINKYGYISGFCVAGSDSVFHWAKAYLNNNRVIVQSNAVKEPIALRYAWANNPGTIDLYSKGGLPVAPFRTDRWPNSTSNKKFNYIQ